MIAYVSELTNGGCNCTFRESILNQQAEWEREKPVKSILDGIFYGKFNNNLFFIHLKLEDWCVLCVFSIIELALKIGYGN